MKRSSHYGKLIPLIVLVSLVFAALTPSAAFAEGDIPEAPATPPVVEDPAEEETPAQVVELLAESGAVIVQDGETLPLASQTALDVVCDPDPYYYGAGITPNCVGGICRYTVLDYAGSALTYALNEWGANKGYGFIYIEHDINQYLLGNKSIDANDSGYATLKGLIGVPGTLGPTPSIQGSLSFTGFTAGFTIQGLYIHDSSETILRFVSNKGTIKIIDTEVKGSTAAEAILIDEHAGAVELNRVSVHNNTGRGIDIDTCNKVGDVCGYVGTVKVTNSAFYNNGLGTPAEGIYIVSGGAITLNGVSVFSNNGTGLEVNGYSSLTIKNSAFKYNRADTDPNRGFGIRIADESRGNILIENVLVQENGKNGMWLYTNTGSITLKKVQAIGNGLDSTYVTTPFFGTRRYGVEIGDGADTEYYPRAGALNVTILDSLFQGNTDTNLIVHSRGAVTLTNVLASKSVGNAGAYITNEYATYAAPVMVVNSIFNDNAGSGLKAYTRGAITLNSITLVNNNKTVDGYSLDVGNPNGTAGVTILSTYGVNRVQNDPGAINIRDGVYIKSNGNVLINNLEVFDHSRFGVSVTTAGSITWKGGGAWNNTKILASTGGSGAILSNGEFLVKPVIVMNARFDGNARGRGLTINSLGAVTLTNVSASNNGYAGVYINTTQMVNILRTLPNSYNSFNDNGLVGTAHTGGHGVYIYTTGNILLSRVQANDNDGSGVFIENSGAVKILGSSAQPVIFNGNEGYGGGATYGIYGGLHIKNTSGAVNISNIQANGNTGAGAYINSGGTVTLSGVLNEFNRNSEEGENETDHYGLMIFQAVGNVSLLNLSLVDNKGGGVFIDNTQAGNVVINSTTTGFTSLVTGGGSKHGGYGVKIETKGSVTINRLSVSDNPGTDGVSITNLTALTSLPVKISLSSFNNNSGIGLDVQSAGAISLSKVTASGNHDQGAYLYNDFSPLLPGQVYMPVTILNSVFNDNDYGGVEVASNRAITISSVTASGNKGGYGVLLDNVDSLPSLVLVTGKNQFNGNSDTGLFIESSGVVTISGVESGKNGGDGINIDTYNQVTISSSWVYGNYVGIKVEDAPVTINNVTSMGNGYYGLDIEYVPVGGKVKLTNSTFILNADAGINIDFDSDLKTDLIMVNVNYFGNNGGGENIYYP